MDDQSSSEIMFLQGAGASMPAGLKDVVTVIPDLLKWLEANQLSTYPNTLECINEIVNIMKSWHETNQKGKTVDIETLLEIIERLEWSFSDIVPEFFRDKSLKLGNICIEILRKRILSRAIKIFIQREISRV